MFYFPRKLQFLIFKKCRYSLSVEKTSGQSCEGVGKTSAWWGASMEGERANAGGRGEASWRTREAATNGVGGAAENTPGARELPESPQPVRQHSHDDSDTVSCLSGGRHETVKWNDFIHRRSSSATVVWFGRQWRQSSGDSESKLEAQCFYRVRFIHFWTNGLPVSWIGVALSAPDCGSGIPTLWICEASSLPLNTHHVNSQRPIVSFELKAHALVLFELDVLVSVWISIFLGNLVLF